MKILKLNQGKEVLIDDEDFDRVNLYRWSVQKRKNGFRAMRKPKPGEDQNIYLHRYILNVPRGLEIDHINHNQLDNRRSNLRIVSHRQNLQSRRGNLKKSIKFKGVSFNRRYLRPFISQITFENRNVYLGCYQNAIEAAKAYDSKAREFFGEFAYLNFPSEVNSNR